MAYVPPGYVPTDPEALSQFLMGELDRLASAVGGSSTSLLYDVLHVEPSKPRQGLTAYADGSDWNPGSGEGLYRYDGTTWHYLG